MAPVTAQLTAHVPLRVHVVIRALTFAVYLGVQLRLWRPTDAEADAFAARWSEWAVARVEFRVS